MSITTEDFNTRIANGGRVYLSEVYERLGFEKPIHPNHQKPFWDKNGFHEDEYDIKHIIISFNEIEIETLQGMYTEYGDKLASYIDTDGMSIDEDRLKDLEDRYNVIKHLCYAIEGIDN